MSVYLGLDKVGVSYLTSAHLFDDQLTIFKDDIYTPWTRPQGWPDLDSLNLSLSGETSFVYMTFRTGHVDDVCAFHVNTVSGGATVELGTISNGTFTATSTESMNSGTEKIYWFTSANGYSDGTIVVKVTGRLSRFYFYDITRANADGGGTIKYYLQPLLERIWYMPEMTAFTTSSGSHGCGTYLLLRDKFGNGTGNALTSTVCAWYYCFNLVSLDISELHTLNVTSMSTMFCYCRKLEYLDVSHFNTAKNTSMYSMFDNCYKIRELDLSTWDTSKLTSSALAYTFRSCYALCKIKGLENFYTNNVTSFVSLFNSCYSLKDLSDITNWNTGKVTNMSSLFNNCYKIKTLNLSKWDVSAVTALNSMFYYCRNLEHIYFPQVLTNTLSGSLASLFNGCYNLLEIDVSWIKPITSAVTSIGNMFTNCRSITEINIPEGWDITGCTASESCYRIFSDCYNLLKITGISNWDMSGYNYSLAYSFQFDYSLKELDIKNWCPHPTNMYYFFTDCISLQKIDLTGWHWENLTGNAIGSMFSGCHSVTEIKGIEHLGDSGNITSFASVFYACWNLTEIPNINSWDPAKVTTCATMFSECRQLQSLTITNWTLTKCTTIANMFRYCYNMKELELTGWSLPALNTNPDYIFNTMSCLEKCSGLPIPLNHRYLDDFSLSEDLWARIFTLLPTVSSKTLYMGTTNINKLTAATKAIATNKGWTLAN